MYRVERQLKWNHVSDSVLKLFEPDVTKISYIFDVHQGAWRKQIDEAGSERVIEDFCRRSLIM